MMTKNNQFKRIPSLLLALSTLGTIAFQAQAVEFEFTYAEELSKLPAEVTEQTPLAHGGFAVDAKTGEVFFGLKRAGIIKMSADLTEKTVLPVTEPMILEGNFHNTTVLYREDGKRFLALPDNEKHLIYIVSDNGQLASILESPTGLNDYYGSGGAFNPTDTEYADGKLYVADGYSAGNYISIADPWTASWTSESFGGKTTSALEYGRFGTAHGITLNPDTKRLAIADRANSRVQDFDFKGTFLSNTDLPAGSLPCDVDFFQGYAIVGCLRGPGNSTPAPLYVLDKDGKMVGEMNPKKDFGLELFTHIHNAAWKPVRDENGRVTKLYALVTAWNPGGFAVFEVNMK